MLTRSELQSKAGISRKELRNWEARNLLVPFTFTTGPAMFKDEYLEIAKLIRSLRSMGVSFDIIQRLLGTEDAESGLAAAHEILNQHEQGLLTAFERLMKFREVQQKKVLKRRYGGFWAFKKRGRLNKGHVPTFISDFIRDLNSQGINDTLLCVHYSNETDESVNVCCFSEQSRENIGKNNSIDYTYVPEYILYGANAIGTVGNYACFDDTYAKIHKTRKAHKAKPPPNETVEIYYNYPNYLRWGQSFDALILS